MVQTFRTMTADSRKFSEIWVTCGVAKTHSKRTHNESEHYVNEWHERLARG